MAFAVPGELKRAGGIVGIGVGASTRENVVPAGPPFVSAAVALSPVPAKRVSSGGVTVATAGALRARDVLLATRCGWRAYRNLDEFAAIAREEEEQAAAVHANERKLYTRQTAAGITNVSAKKCNDCGNLSRKLGAVSPADFDAAVLAAEPLRGGIAHAIASVGGSVIFPPRASTATFAEDSPLSRRFGDSAPRRPGFARLGGMDLIENGHLVLHITGLSFDVLALSMWSSDEPRVALPPEEQSSSTSAAWSRDDRVLLAASLNAWQRDQPLARRERNREGILADVLRELVSPVPQWQPQFAFDALLLRACAEWAFGTKSDIRPFHLEDVQEKSPLFNILGATVGALFYQFSQVARQPPWSRAAGVSAVYRDDDPDAVYRDDPDEDRPSTRRGEKKGKQQQSGWNLPLSAANPLQIMTVLEQRVASLANRQEARSLGTPEIRDTLRQILERLRAFRDTAETLNRNSGSDRFALEMTYAWDLTAAATATDTTTITRSSSSSSGASRFSSSLPLSGACALFAHPAAGLVSSSGSGVDDGGPAVTVRFTLSLCPTAWAGSTRYVSPRAVQLAMARYGRYLGADVLATAIEAATQIRVPPLPIPLPQFGALSREIASDRRYATDCTDADLDRDQFLLEQGAPFIANLALGPTTLTQLRARILGGGGGGGGVSQKDDMTKYASAIRALYPSAADAYTRYAQSRATAKSRFSTLPPPP